MTFIVLTLFPELCAAVLGESILGRAADKGILHTDIRGIRQYSTDRHRRVDDDPFGWGRGMLMMPQPFKAAVDAVTADYGHRPHTIYLSPKGRVFSQAVARELLAYDKLLFLCGHYEGVDQRILDTVVDEELSLGDFVLTGGELPALCIIDAVARMVPGVLAGAESYENESIYSGLLEYPQYTRPAVFEGMEVPEVLRNGNHGEIAKWQREQSLIVTAQRRPDLLAAAALTPQEKDMLRQRGLWPGLPREEV